MGPNGPSVTVTKDGYGRRKESVRNKRTTLCVTHGSFVSAENCQHHWLIEPANGPTSRGVCLRCGEEREFLNSLDDYGPERRIAAHQMYATPGEKLGAWLMAEAYRE